MSFALLFAILSPFFFALSNIVDKYVIGRHVKDVVAFTSVTGILSVLVGGLLALFLDWTGTTLWSVVVTSCVGVLMGVQFFIYMKVLEKQDVSHVIGIAYIYPVIIMILAYVFLAERVPFVAYIGAFLTVIGALMLSARLDKTTLRMSAIGIGGIILTSAFGEFFVKVSTNNLGVWQGIAISALATGFTLLCGLFWPSVRKNALRELRNIHWSALSDLTLFLALGASFFAMADMSATVASSIAAVQPLFVLAMERLIHWRTGDYSRDVLLLPKLGAIALIVSGVALLSYVSL